MEDQCILAGLPEVLALMATPGITLVRPACTQAIRRAHTVQDQVDMVDMA